MKRSRPPALPCPPCRLLTLFAGILAVWFLVFSLALPALAQEDLEQPSAGVNLRPAWQPGQTARYEIWSRRDRETTASVAGQTHHASVTMLTEGEIRWAVEQVQSDGSATCTMTLEWLRMTLTNHEGEQQSFDTRRGGADLPPVFSAMAGTPLRIEVGADGSVRRVNGLDAVRQQLPQGHPAPEERDFMRTASDLALLVGGPSDVQPGQQWHTRHAWRHDIGTMHHRVTHTLESVGEIEGVSIATILSDAQLDLEVDDSAAPPGQPPVDVRLLEGTRQAQTLYDLRRHEPVGRNSLERISVEISMRLPDQTLTQRVDETIHSQALRIEER